MKKVIVAIGVSALVGAWSLPTSFAKGAHHTPHWTYTGDEGAEHWGELDPAFAMCGTGRAQSPIDIRGAHAMGLQPIEFNYKPISNPEIVNNGHTIQVNYANGSNIIVGGKRYDLLQFHFHTPAENLIEGYRAPMSAHLVHKSGDGQLAVIGIKMDVGTENAFLAPVVQAAPNKEGKGSVSVELDINKFLPADKAYFNFSGSLTTPPCSEGVSWNVMKNRVTVSKAQLDTIHKIIGNNARPIQPLNGRMIGEL